MGPAKKDVSQVKDPAWPEPPTSLASEAVSVVMHGFGSMCIMQVSAKHR